MSQSKDSGCLTFIGVLALIAVVPFTCLVLYGIMTWANDGGISGTLDAFGDSWWGIYCCYGTMCLGMLSGLAFPASKGVAVIFVKR